MTRTPLTPDLLLQGYAAGIFPMADGRDADDIYWVDPRKRGILPLDGFHVSRSLARRLRRGDYQVSLNQDFRAVVTACADREDTWINDEIFDLYAQLHDLGFAHSLEIHRNNDLIGGIYGVALGAAFFGESMFSRGVDGSKIALAYLVARLRMTGYQLLDTQFITPHLASLGAIEISRREYQSKLKHALQARGDILADVALPGVHDVMQRKTQTS